MKKLLMTVLVMAALAVTASVSHAATWNVGDRVLVNWTGDDYWYPATIVTIDGSKYYVIYCDEDREWVTASRIAALDIQVGDRIECNWQNKGYYYEGKITVKKGDMIHISYDDGDQEDTTIEYIRILR